MAKKNLGAIAEAFGAVEKAAEQNKKEREEKEKVFAEFQQQKVAKETEIENKINEEDYEEPERKTKRVNFLLYPSAYEIAVKQAKRHKQTLNDYVNSLLKQQEYK